MKKIISLFIYVFVFALWALLMTVTYQSCGSENNNPQRDYRDSVIVRDSVVVKDSLIINVKDSVVYNVKDSINVIDSVKYIYRDSTILNVKDSVILNVKVNEIDLKKFLFGPDSLIDKDVHYLLSNKDSVISNHNFDKNYPDYFNLKFYFDPTEDTTLWIDYNYYKETGLSKAQEVELPYSYDHGYMIFSLGEEHQVDSIILLTNQPGRELFFYFEQPDGTFKKDGSVILNGTYIPNQKKFMFINISTPNGINWEIKKIKVFGK